MFFFKAVHVTLKKKNKTCTTRHKQDQSIPSTASLNDDHVNTSLLYINLTLSPLL